MQNYSEHMQPYIILILNISLTKSQFRVTTPEQVTLKEEIQQLRIKQLKSEHWYTESIFKHLIDYMSEFSFSFLGLKGAKIQNTFCSQMFPYRLSVKTKRAWYSN